MARLQGRFADVRASSALFFASILGEGAVPRVRFRGWLFLRSLPLSALFLS
jgi:hypothetical protein